MSDSASSDSSGLFVRQDEDSGWAPAPAPASAPSPPPPSPAGEHLSHALPAAPLPTTKFLNAEELADLLNFANVEDLNDWLNGPRVKPYWQLFMLRHLPAVGADERHIYVDIHDVIAYLHDPTPEGIAQRMIPTRHIADLTKHCQLEGGAWLVHILTWANVHSPSGPLNGSPHDSDIQVNRLYRQMWEVVLHLAQEDSVLHRIIPDAVGQPLADNGGDFHPGPDPGAVNHLQLVQRWDPVICQRMPRPHWMAPETARADDNNVVLRLIRWDMTNGNARGFVIIEFVQACPSYDDFFKTVQNYLHLDTPEAVLTTQISSIRAETKDGRFSDGVNHQNFHEFVRYCATEQADGSIGDDLTVLHPGVVVALVTTLAIPQPLQAFEFR